MDDTITTIYCLCDEFLKAWGHCHDPQARLSTAELMSVSLVAATFFGGNVEQARRFLHEYATCPPRSPRVASTAACTPSSPNSGGASFRC